MGLSAVALLSACGHDGGGIGGWCCGGCGGVVVGASEGFVGGGVFVVVGGVGCVVGVVIGVSCQSGVDRTEFQSKLGGGLMCLLLAWSRPPSRKQSRV